MDPCVNLDDPLPGRVNKFLESFQKHLNQRNIQEPSSQDVRVEQAEQLEPPPTEREHIKSTVRFQETPEFMDSPILGQQPSRRSLFQTPIAAPIPYARSTPTQFGV